MEAREDSCESSALLLLAPEAFEWRFKNWTRTFGGFWLPGFVDFDGSGVERQPSLAAGPAPKS